MSIEIRPIQLPKDAAAFIDVWWTVYKGDPHWVPPLRFERLHFLDPKKNPYFKFVNAQCFIAYRDGVPVGTISAQVDLGYQVVEDKMGFFGFFEFVDDEAVARGLLDAALAWLRSQGDVDKMKAQQAAQAQTQQLLAVMQQGADVAKTLKEASPTVGQGGAGGVL